MSLTPSEVASLTSALSWWERAEYICAALVTLGCLGEYIAEFTDWFTGGTKQHKERLAKRSTLLLIGALALELVCLVRTNQISGSVIGALGERAMMALQDSNTAIAQSGNAAAAAKTAEEASTRAVGKSDKAEKSASGAMTLAGGARREADSFERDIVSAKEQAANAESHLTEALRRAADAQSELARFRAPRTISPTEQVQMSRALEAFAGTPFDLSVAGDAESIDLMHVVQTVLVSANWRQVAATGDLILQGVTPSIGITLNSGVFIEIDAARRSQWEGALRTLVLLLQAEAIAVRGNIAQTGSTPNAIHVMIGMKPRN